MSGQRGRALPERRRVELMRVIANQGQATVSELADAFDVSLDTVRRDLDTLASHGRVERTHGGAIASGTTQTRGARAFGLRAETATAAKAKVGKVAADLVADGATVLLNGGSTTVQVAAHVTASDIKVVTNNLKLLEVLDPAVTRSVDLVGGRYWREGEVTVGPVQLPGVADFTADIAFIGVAGVSHDSGLTANDAEEGQMMREMLERTNCVVVVCDQKKFDRTAFAHVAPLRWADVLVAEAAPTGPLAQALQADGVEVVVA